jgi:hypothetical protein
VRSPDTALPDARHSESANEAHLYRLASCGDEALAEFETENPVEPALDARPDGPLPTPEEPAHAARRWAKVGMTAVGVLMMGALMIGTIGVPAPPNTSARRPPAPEVLSARPTMAAPLAPLPPPRAPQLSGSWRLTSRVVSSDVQRFSGLVLGYALRIEQDGEHLRGDGFKSTENGRPLAAGARTPIAVVGTIDNEQVQLAFTETGTRRTSHGAFALRLVEDGSLNGRFWSDAARSSGSVTAMRAD